MINGSNSIGGVLKAVIPSREMELFDQLPRVIREELTHSPIDFAVEDVYSSWQTASREDGLSAWEFKDWMSKMFRQQTRSLSVTGVENGSYKITRIMKSTGLPTVPRARTRF